MGHSKRASYRSSNRLINSQKITFDDMENVQKSCLFETLTRAATC